MDLENGGGEKTRREDWRRGTSKTVDVGRKKKDRWASGTVKATCSAYYKALTAYITGRAFLGPAISESRSSPAATRRL